MCYTCQLFNKFEVNLILSYVNGQYRYQAIVVSNHIFLVIKLLSVLFRGICLSR